MASCLHPFADHQKHSTSPNSNDQDVERLLRPLVDAYKAAIYERRYEDAQKFYHPNAVLVESEQRCHHTPPAIVRAISEYREPLQPAKTITENEIFSGNGDVFSYRNSWVLENDKEILRGPFVQVWVRNGDHLSLYHEEFAIQERTKKH
ncbi:unnamed protein product, partial [Mesorhabditis belari]|uniref:Uncharacterized protein n=1 Tax=Mesorhabditis belari TaxID=2138241 RepID=A0AAF3J915_9BILA